MLLSAASKAVSTDASVHIGDAPCKSSCREAPVAQEVLEHALCLTLICFLFANVGVYLVKPVYSLCAAVFGWVNASVRRVERSQAYTLLAVNAKQDPESFQNYSFDIHTNDETVEGSSDYLVFPTLVQFFFLDHQPKPIEFTFRPDDLLESDESFLVSLESNSVRPLPRGPNVFFRKTVRLTIVDGNGKSCVNILSVVKERKSTGKRKLRRCVVVSVSLLELIIKY